MYSSHRFLINRRLSLLDMISDDLRDVASQIFSNPLEVMGLAVLPARLKNEMALMEDAIISGNIKYEMIPQIITGFRSSRHSPS